MDLGMIKTNLSRGHYRNAQEFAADFRRMISETYRYCIDKDPLIMQAGWDSEFSGTIFLDHLLREGDFVLETYVKEVALAVLHCVDQWDDLTHYLNLVQHS